jgi:hypothetical protein
VPHKSDPSRSVEFEKTITQDDLEDSLCKFRDDPVEVAKYFLRTWGVLYAGEALVGFFDIYAYSAFIEKHPREKCISEIGEFFNTVVRDAGSFFLDIKLKHWILSDSLIITLDTDSYPG